MKLNAQQVAAVRRQVEADPLPEDNPAMTQLVNVFGLHTFYVGVEGLLVLEPANDPASQGEPARFIRLAAWTDEQRSALQPVDPEPTELVVDLAVAPGAGNGKAE
jgi:hypothetical protein